MKKILVTIFSIFSLSQIIASPIINDDVGIVDKEDFEIETYYTSNNEACFILKHGITPKIDIGLLSSCNYSSDQKEKLSPLEVSIKYLIIDNFLTFKLVNELGDSNYVCSLIFYKEIYLPMHFNGSYFRNVENGGYFTYGLYTESNIKKNLTLIYEYHNDSQRSTFATGVQYYIKKTSFNLGFTINDINTKTFLIGIKKTI